MTVNYALGQKIKKIRKEMGKTQLEFAMYCGLSEDEICNLEHGKTDPKLSTLESIAEYLGYSLHDLFKEEEDIVLL